MILNVQKKTGIKKGDLKKFAKFTGKYLFLSLLFILSLLFTLNEFHTFLLVFLLLTLNW